MKKIILTFIAMLLAGVNTAWADDLVQIGSQGYATIQEAINAVTDGTATTITFVSSDAAVSGNGFQIPDGTSGKNIIIDFNGCTYTVTGGAVGSTGTENQCMHFAPGNTLKLTNGTIQVQSGLSDFKIMMQNYCDLTLDHFNVDCSNIITQTYSGSSYGVWEGKTRPVFNFNSGTSTITYSTITFNSTDQFGLLADNYKGSAASVTIGTGTTINGNVTALGGNAIINAGTINGNVLVDKVETNQAQGSVIIDGGKLNGSASSNYGTLTINDDLVVARLVRSDNTTSDFTNLNAAFAAANVASGSTLTMQKNVTINYSSEGDDDHQEVTGNFTLDLNGKTIEGKKYSNTNIASLINVSRGGTLTITDASGNNSGKIYSSKTYTMGVTVGYEGNNVDANAGVATLIVNSGQLEGKVHGIAGNGMGHFTNITINGGVISGISGIYHPQMGTLTITDGTIKGSERVLELRAGNLNISGGEFELTGNDAYRASSNNSGMSVRGAVVGISQHTLNNDPTKDLTEKPINVVISGGTFKSKSDAQKALCVVNPQGNTTDDVTVSVTGGDFQGGVVKTDDRVDGFVKGGTYTEKVPLNCLATGKICSATKNDNNRYTILDGQYVAQSGDYGFETFAAAIQAATDDCTVTLLNNITLAADITCPLVDGENFTISLGEKTITKGDYSVSLATGVTVTTDKATDIFTAADQGSVIVATKVGDSFSYSAVDRANVVDGEAQIVGDITTPYQTLADAFAAVQDGETIELLKNVTLSSDIVCPLTSGTIYFKFGGFKVNKGNSSIKLKIAAANGARAAVPAANVGGPVVYTDNQTDIFTAAGSGDVLLVNYDPTNTTYPYSYQTVPGDQSIDEAVARNEETGMLFSDLQFAIDLAQAGQTITVLKDATLNQTININKGITLDGQNHQLTSTVDADDAIYSTSPASPCAFRVTGDGPVTINKLNVDVPFEGAPAGIYSQYLNGGIGILVDDNYSHPLTINYGEISTHSRGIDVKSVGNGFTLDIAHTKLYGYCDTVPQFDPEKHYINSFDSDPFGRGRGINFRVSGVKANIQFCEIAGFAYPINANKESSDLDVTIIDCTTYGRCAVNNWGNRNKFTVNNVKAHAANSQKVGDTETFAAIVDNNEVYREYDAQGAITLEQITYKASYNTYLLNDLKVIANVDADDASSTTDATQKFLDLRGTDATAKITGSSCYDIADDSKDRVGFMNNEQMHDLIDPAINNRVYFDDQAKAYFSYWFESMKPWEEGGVLVHLTISDEKDYTELYPVIAEYPKVMLTVGLEDLDNGPQYFYYTKLSEAFASNYFESAAEITIMDRIDLDEDITPNLKRGEEFTLTSLKDINGTSYSINKNGHKIFLDPLVIANYDIDAENYDYYDNPTGLFAPSDSTITTVLIRKTEDLVGTNYVPRYVYTAANVYWSGDVNDIDPDLSFYWLWDELFTKDENAVAVFAPDTYTRLEMDLTLTSDRKLPTSMGGFEWEEEGEPARRMVDDIVGMKYWLDFNNFTIDKSDYSIALIVGDSVYTTATTDVFSSADPAYYVTYDVLASDSIKENEKGANVLFKYRYYLQKDGLAVTVDPATFCGDRLTPTFQVKKKDPATDTWKVVNGITKEEYDNRIAAAAANIPPTDPDLDGVDFYWYLVPPVSADDDSTYVSAKTYHGALVIEGITFQGTRKADFTILPRDIKDVVVKDSTNILKWRAEGYTPAQIADTLLLVYNCLTHNSDTLLTKYNATTKKGDYLISVADGPEAGGKYLEVDTYSQVITVTAVEGGNYTGSLKLDFIITQDGLIDLSQCMVVSDATYTSDTLPPLKRRLKVILKDPATGTETVVDSAAYTLEVHGAPESYINAQTYSNAITIKGRSTYIPSDGSSTTPVKGYYGSLDADYVIKPRDLADSLDVIAEKDNQGKVTLEAYAGANKPATTPATIYLKWTGSELLPVINSNDADKNNINLILTAQKDTLPGQSTSAKVVYPLIAADYSYTIEPAPMVDPGIYKIIFTGRGNFKGMREVNVMVLKDINSPSIASEVPLQIIPNNDNLKPSELKDIVVKDGDQTLVLGTHYSVTVIGQDKTEYTETNPIITDSIYSVIFKGIEPYYFEADTAKMIVLYEFYSYDTANNGGAYYNNLPNGYVPANPAMSIRVLSGKELNCLVGDYPKSRKSAIDSTLLTFTIPETATITIDMGTTTGIYDFNLKVVGIEDSSFYSCDTLHWVDATAIKGYTPSTLSRSDVGPFAGYPVQSLVYLDGSSVSGTNYVYEVSPGTFECEELKIYDDVQGDQQMFNEGGGPKWDFRNKYEFTADKVTNTRYFTKGQHYTTCLPYRMEMPADMKVYTLDAASDKIFGFKELSLDSLRAFTPYLLIPSKAGNMLNNPGSTIVYVTPTADEGKLNPVVTPTGSASPNATMYGSMIYMDKNTTVPLVEGLYIMQSQNTWLQIPADNEYNKACVLPMRAYIGVPKASPSREIMYSKFVDAVEKLKVDVADDWTNAEVYDLQGRKVDTTARLPKGVYIVNGQKRIRK